MAEKTKDGAVKAYETVTSDETKQKLSESVSMVIDTATDPAFYSKIKDKTVQGAEAVAGYTFLVQTQFLSLNLGLR